MPKQLREEINDVVVKYLKYKLQTDDGFRFNSAETKRTALRPISPSCRSCYAAPIAGSRKHGAACARGKRPCGEIITISAMSIFHIYLHSETKYGGRN
jgi:hypothetical protein